MTIQIGPATAIQGITLFETAIDVLPNDILTHIFKSHVCPTEVDHVLVGVNKRFYNIIRSERNVLILHVIQVIKTILTQEEISFPIQVLPSNPSYEIGDTLLDILASVPQGVLSRIVRELSKLKGRFWTYHQWFSWIVQVVMIYDSIPSAGGDAKRQALLDLISMKRSEDALRLLKKHGTLLLRKELCAQCAEQCMSTRDFETSFKFIIDIPAPDTQEDFLLQFVTTCIEDGVLHIAMEASKHIFSRIKREYAFATVAIAFAKHNDIEMAIKNICAIIDRVIKNEAIALVLELFVEHPECTVGLFIRIQDMFQYTLRDNLIQRCAINAYHHNHNLLACDLLDMIRDAENSERAYILMGILAAEQNAISQVYGFLSKITEPSAKEGYYSSVCQVFAKQGQRDRVDEFFEKITIESIRHDTIIRICGAFAGCRSCHQHMEEFIHKVDQLDGDVRDRVYAHIADVFARAGRAFEAVDVFKKIDDPAIQQSALQSIVLGIVEKSCDLEDPVPLPPVELEFFIHAIENRQLQDAIRKSGAVILTVHEQHQMAKKLLDSSW